MEILESIDVEEVIREALQPYTAATVYTHELPATPNLPCVRIMRTSGTRADTIDTHQVVIQYRAAHDYEAEELANRMNAVLEAIAKGGETDIRHAQLVTHGNWGNDPARPEISMRQATYSVTAHPVAKEVTENE